MKALAAIFFFLHAVFLVAWGQKSPFHCIKDERNRPAMRKGDAWCLPDDYSKERPDFMGEFKGQ